MGRHVAGESPAMDRLVDEASLEIGRDIEALRVPRLRGVVLGGGYGRGEGGVRVRGGVESLSNDLDFYVVAEDGSSAAELAGIGEALAPVSKEWTARLGVDVDFCGAKTPWRMHHDQERVMIQELIHGYFDVAGEKGETLFAGIERRRPEDFPWMEAVRLLMNRGVGLMLATESGRTDEFKVRNINKCILGAGDARLIARRAYAWRATERAEKLGDALYAKAVEWKFRPSDDAVCDWETARGAWMDAEAEVLAAGSSSKELGRSVYQAARWLARRRTVGDIATFGQNCVVRVLRRLARHVRARETLTASLRRDWEIFN